MPRLPAPYHSPPMNPASPSASPPLAASSKKKHICSTCDRAFTTSGHLARHGRIHTGERNHKCPFPGCETRCSRQDNLQQHYRIHLSPGSRRSSSSATRQAIARAMSNDGQSSAKRSAVPGTSSIAGLVLSTPPPDPPALEHARQLAPSPPPESPPPLAQATLPATAHPPPPDSVSSRSSSSPELAYSDLMHGHALAGGQAQPYRSGTSTYQEQSQGSAAFTYVHTSPIAQHSSGASVDMPQHGIHADSFSYSGPYENHSHSPVHHIDDTHTPSPASSGHLSLSSRHSISHISHPQSYTQSSPPTAGPPSPSTSSHTMPSHNSHSHSSYPMYRENGHESNAYPNSNLDSLPAYHSSQSQLVHGGYTPSLAAQQGTAPSSHRYDSPPPTLAPIQDERVVRGSQRAPPPPLYQHHSSPSTFMHHAQPSANYYYSSGMPLPQYGIRGRDAMVQ